MTPTGQCLSFDLQNSSTQCTNICGWVYKDINCVTTTTQRGEGTKLYSSNIKLVLILTINVCAQLPSCVQPFMTLWTVTRQAPLSMVFSRQEYWSGLPFPPLRESFQPRDKTQISCISCIAGRVFTAEPLRKPIN